MLQINAFLGQFLKPFNGIHHKEAFLTVEIAVSASHVKILLTVTRLVLTMLATSEWVKWMSMQQPPGTETPYCLSGRIILVEEKGSFTISLHSLHFLQEH